VDPGSITSAGTSFVRGFFASAVPKRPRAAPPTPDDLPKLQADVAIGSCNARRIRGLRDAEGVAGE
jgi:hypothetical protein